jgi:hypothetical protein
MRWPGILARVIGWLLAPFVAWAASFYGAWLVLSLGGRPTHPWRSLAIALSVALLTGVGILLAWMRLLRRSPRLRHSLHVDPEGLPVIDDDAPEESPTDQAPS